VNLEILKQLTFSEIKAFIITEDAGTMIVWTIENFTPNSTVSHLRRLESSATVLREPQTLHVSRTPT